MRQVLRPGALGRPRGIGWRERWEQGSGWGIHVTPWLTHVNVWQKSLQYCKVIGLQLIKINGKKNTTAPLALEDGLNHWTAKGNPNLASLSLSVLSRKMREEQCWITVLL